MTQQDWHLAYFPLLAAVEKTTVEGGFIIPVYDQTNNEMGYMSTSDLILNPTEEFIPYRGSTSFKDSPVQFDVSEDILISSVPAIVPRKIASVSDTYTILPTDDLIEYTSGTFDATLPEASGSKGKEYDNNNIGAGIITLKSLGGTIGGLTEQTIPPSENLKVYSNGTNWEIL